MNIATGTIFSSVHRVRYSCLPEDASTGMPMSSAISTSESASDAVPSEVVASDSLYSASVSIRVPLTGNRTRPNTTTLIKSVTINAFIPGFRVAAAPSCAAGPEKSANT